MTVVLVTGGRDFTDAKFVMDIFDYYHEKLTIKTIIHGGAKGVDTFAGLWAKENKLQTFVFPVTKEDWQELGKKAGILRNKNMVDLNLKDITHVFAFPGGNGTKHCKEYAKSKGLNVIEFINGETIQNDQQK